MFFSRGPSLTCAPLAWVRRTTERILAAASTHAPRPQLWAAPEAARSVVRPVREPRRVFFILTHARVCPQCTAGPPLALLPAPGRRGAARRPAHPPRAGARRGRADGVGRRTRLRATYPALPNLSPRGAAGPLPPSRPTAVQTGPDLKTAVHVATLQDVVDVAAALWRTTVAALPPSTVNAVLAEGLARWWSLLLTPTAAGVPFDVALFRLHVHAVSAYAAPDAKRARMLGATDSRRTAEHDVRRASDLAALGPSSFAYAPHNRFRNLTVGGPRCAGRVRRLGHDPEASAGRVHGPGAAVPAKRQTRTFYSSLCLARVCNTLTDHTPMPTPHHRPPRSLRKRPSSHCSTRSGRSSGSWCWLS